MGKRAASESSGGQPKPLAKRARETTPSRVPGVDTLQHCDICQANSKDSDFDTHRMLEHYAARQCSACYNIFLPLSLVIDWNDFVHKYRNEPNFKDQVDGRLAEAKMLPQRPGFRAHLPESADRERRVECKLSRHAHFIQKHELKNACGASATPKQLRLPPSTDIEGPTGKVSGWLVNDSRHPYLQVELSSTASFSTTTSLLPSSCSSLQGIGATLQANEMPALCPLPDAKLNDFLIGKNHITLGDLFSRGKKWQALQELQQKRGSSASGVLEEEEEDEDYSDGDGGQSQIKE
jgi:hypothetical protein